MRWGVLHLHVGCVACAVCVFWGFRIVGLVRDY